MEEKLELRRYQASLESRVFKAWEKGSKNILMQLPTGGGKTSVFSSIAQKFISKNLKILVVAHKEELVLQNAKSLEKWCNSTCGLIKAGYKPDYSLNLQRLGFADDDRHWNLDRTPIVIGSRRDDRSAGNPPNAYEIQKIDLIEITAAAREAEREKRKNIEREERKRQREAKRQKKAALKLQEEQAAQRKQEEEQLKLRRETLEAEARAKAYIDRQQEQEAALKAQKQRELEDIARKEAEVKRQHKIAQQTFLDQRARRQKDREFAAELETRKIMEKLRAEQLKDDEECEAILKERKILEIDQLEMEENAHRRHQALVNLHKKQKWERIRAMVNEESREEAIDRLKEIDDHQYSWFTQSLLLNDLDTPGIKTLIRFYYDVDYNSAHGKHYAEDLWNFIIGQLIRYESEGVRNKKWGTDLLEKMPTPKWVWERIAIAFEYKPGWVHYKTR